MNFGRILKIWIIFVCLSVIFAPIFSEAITRKITHQALNSTSNVTTTSTSTSVSTTQKSRFQVIQKVLFDAQDALRYTGRQVLQQVENAYEFNRDALKELKSEISYLKDKSKTDIYQPYALVFHSYQGLTPRVSRIWTEVARQNIQTANTVDAATTSGVNNILKSTFDYVVDKGADALLPLFYDPNDYVMNVSVPPRRSASIGVATSTDVATANDSDSGMRTGTQPARSSQSISSGNISSNSVMGLIQSLISRVSFLENIAHVPLTPVVNNYYTNTYADNAVSAIADSVGRANVSNTDSLRNELLTNSSLLNTNIFDYINTTSTSSTSTFAGNVSANTVSANYFYGDGSQLTGISVGSSFSTSTTRSVFSSSATGLTYNNTTGDFSLTSGYNIPLTASTTEWANKVSSQWTTSGSDISYTAGKVGIGTSSPSARLQVESTDTSTAWFVNTADVSGSAGAGMIGYTLGTPTASDQRLGFLLFGSRAGGSQQYNAAGISAYASAAWTAGSSHPTHLIFETTPSGSTSRNERLRITSAGNVGIGTTTPSAKLAITGTAGTGDIFAIASSTDARLLTFTSTGRLGIGTSNPSNLLEVSGGYASLGGVTIGANNIAFGALSSAMYWPNATIIETSADGILKLSNYARTDFGRLQFGGTTSAFPAIKRNGAGVDFRLADDSGYATTTANVGLFLGSVGVGTTTPNGSMTARVLQVENSSGYTQIYGLSAASAYGSVFTQANNSGVRFEISSYGSTNALSSLFGVSRASNTFMYSYSGTALSIGTLSTQNLTLGTNSTANLTIQSGGNVGIGTTTPSAKLAITGTAGTGDVFVVASSTNTHMFVVKSSGNVGIGTNSPGVLFDVVDSVNGGSGFKVRDSAGTTYFKAYGTAGGSFTSLANDAILIDNFYGIRLTGGNLPIQGLDSSATVARDLTIKGKTITFNTGNTSSFTNNSMFLDSAGNVGIGTTTPSSTLSVAGGINLTGALKFNENPGTSGMVLQSSGTSASWVATSSLGISGGASQWTTSGSHIYYSTGNIGIGTSTPSGSIAVSGSNSTELDAIVLDNTAATGNQLTSIKFANAGYKSSAIKSILFAGGNDTGLKFQTTVSSVLADRLSINQTGGVDISGALSVTGAISNAASISLSGSGAEYTAMTLTNTGGSSNQLTGISFLNTSYSGSAIKSRLNTGGTSTDLKFFTSTGSSLTEKMVIDGNGYVGIGTSTPAFPLDVYSTVDSDQTYGYLNSSGLIGTSSGTNSYSIRAQGRILASEFNAVSDARLKDVQFDLDGQVALDALVKLNPVSFTWKDNPTGQPVLGFLAQDVETAIPNAVSKIKTEKFDDQRELSYNQIVAVAVGAIKKIKSEIDTIKGQLANVISWFGNDTFKVQGQICVDEVCVSKDQFKSILLNNGAYVSVPMPTSSGGTSNSLDTTSSTTSSGSSSSDTTASSTDSVSGSSGASSSSESGNTTNTGTENTGGTSDTSSTAGTSDTGNSTNSIQVDTSTSISTDTIPTTDGISSSSSPDSSGSTE